MAAPASQQQLLSRRLFAGGLLGCAAVAATGCTGDSAQAGSASESDAAAEEPLIVCLRRPTCVDPYNCATAADRQLVWQLFDSLTAYDDESQSVVGRAAQSWEASQDAREFTFHLVAGATFHNGESVTSASFRRAWERIVNPSSTVANHYGASDLAYLLSLVEGYDELVAGTATGLSGLSCPDDETLVVSLTRAFADFPALVAHPALAPVPYAASYDPESYAASPVGNGPFQLAEGASWQDDAAIELVRFEAYQGEPAAVDAVRLLVTDDAEEAFRAFQSGDADVADVPIGELSAAKRICGTSDDGRTMAAEERLLIGSEPALSYLVCNLGRTPLESADIRRAVSLAIDRDAICKSVYRRTREAAGGVVPPGVAGYREDAWEGCAYDAELAQELLEVAYPVLDEEGSRGLELGLAYYADGGHDEAVELIVDDLAAVGVSVEPEPLGWDELLECCAAGEFDLALFSWTLDFASADNALYPLLHSDSAGGANRSGYADDEFDALVDEARSLVDEEERVAALQAAEDAAGADMPIIPLWYFGHVIAGSDRIASLYCGPDGRLDLAGAELT